MGVWNKLIPALMDDLEGFTTTVEKVTVDVLWMYCRCTRELEIESEDVTELLQSRDKT